MNVNLLLDKSREICKANSDSELADKLGISKQAISSYRKGTRLPDAVICEA
ncbi:helix-turn-helix domain-containing protein, partial [Xylella fastidiosa]|uniref:helix-turn-helix domain-containing protein n=1 Tax=Xylella fastidiosa TaxID=2371 RepID=UPI003CCF9B53